MENIQKYRNYLDEQVMDAELQLAAWASRPDTQIQELTPLCDRKEILEEVQAKFDSLFPSGQ